MLSEKGGVAAKWQWTVIMLRIEARLKMYLVHLHPADVRKRLQKNRVDIYAAGNGSRSILVGSGFPEMCDVKRLDRLKKPEGPALDGGKKSEDDISQHSVTTRPGEFK
ncbi:hypothetical protein B0H14DRAFT_2593173 [Mycena olivaceomarginata]|nr:hypothetical protein B0H14DRAFT_2593173 [Mycena olivaceomarginata]